MFSIALVILAISGALSFATPAKRAPALEVSLTAPTEVHSIDDIKVTAAVTNTGSEPLKVLKFGTVLDSQFPTQPFAVSKDGVAANFTGIRLQLDLEALDESAYVVIPAGETVIVEHDVAPLYDFEALGTGAFEFEPAIDFQVVDAGAELNAFKVSATKIKVNVKSDVSRRELKAFEKRARVTCSNSAKASFISASYTEGKSLGQIAANYIASHGADALFKAYYGSGSTAVVRTVFLNVANENSTTRTLSCTDDIGACMNGVIAYTYIPTTNIYYCPIFFNEVATSRLCTDTSVASRNVRGGTTLHELTHATSRTIDVGYGCAFDQDLGQRDPARAMTNADNYNCFATQVYQNARCP